MAEAISKRSLTTLKFPNFKRLWAPKARLNKYHETDNPEVGIIPMCVHVHIIAQCDFSCIETKTNSS